MDNLSRTTVPSSIGLGKKRRSNPAGYHYRTYWYEWTARQKMELGFTDPGPPLTWEPSPIFPTLTLDWLRERATPEAAEIAGIYFLLDDVGVVYVGRSRNCAQRVRTHSRGPEMLPYQAVFCLPVPIEDHVAAERHYILMFNPKFNLDILTQRARRAAAARLRNEL